MDSDPPSEFKPLPMIRDEITYEEAKAKEANILHQLSYYDQELKFLVHIYRNRDLIRGIIAHHLYRRMSRCRCGGLDSWELQCMPSSRRWYARKKSR